MDSRKLANSLQRLVWSVVEIGDPHKIARTRIARRRRLRQLLQWVEKPLVLWDGDYRLSHQGGAWEEGSLWFLREDSALVLLLAIGKALASWASKEYGERVIHINDLIYQKLPRKLTWQLILPTGSSHSPQSFCSVPFLASDARKLMLQVRLPDVSKCSAVAQLEDLCRSVSGTSQERWAQGKTLGSRPGRVFTQDAMRLPEVESPGTMDGNVDTHIRQCVEVFECWLRDEVARVASTLFPRTPSSEPPSGAQDFLKQILTTSLLSAAVCSAASAPLQEVWYIPGRGVINEWGVEESTGGLMIWVDGQTTFKLDPVSILVKETAYRRRLALGDLVDASRELADLHAHQTCLTEELRALTRQLSIFIGGLHEAQERASKQVEEEFHRECRDWTISRILELNADQRDVIGRSIRGLRRRSAAESVTKAVELFSSEAQLQRVFPFERQFFEDAAQKTRVNARQVRQVLRDMLGALDFERYYLGKIPASELRRAKRRAEMLDGTSRRSLRHVLDTLCERNKDRPERARQACIDHVAALVAMELKGTSIEPSPTFGMVARMLGMNELAELLSTFRGADARIFSGQNALPGDRENRATLAGLVEAFDKSWKRIFTIDVTKLVTEMRVSLGTTVASLELPSERKVYPYGRAEFRSIVAQIAQNVSKHGVQGTLSVASYVWRSKQTPQEKLVLIFTNSVGSAAPNQRRGSGMGQIKNAVDDLNELPDAAWAVRFGDASLQRTFPDTADVPTWESPGRNKWRVEVFCPLEKTEGQEKIYAG